MSHEPTIAEHRIAAFAAAPHNVGDRLTNGAILLEESLPTKTTEQYVETVVLAMAPGAVEPFATWTRTVGVGPLAGGGFRREDYTFHGHYFRRLNDAMTDFDKRTK